LHSFNEENSQNKHADFDGNFFGGVAVTVKSLYKLDLYKIPLDGAFVRANIHKHYLLQSHTPRCSTFAHVVATFCHVSQRS